MGSQKDRHILIFRLSALGDVAIASPLVKEYARRNPNIRFTFISQPKMEPMFREIENLDFIPFIKGERDFWNIIKFARSLLKFNPTDVADIHNVLRSKIFTAYMLTRGLKCKTVFKNRAEKKQLIRQKNKVLIPLKTSQRAYEEVFVALGLKDLHFADTPVQPREKSKFLYRRIGIAPFAMHKGKCWPLEYMEQVVEELGKDSNTRVILFGGKGYESELLKGWENKYQNVESVAGRYTLAEELEFIKSLDVMVSMDSANMHFASLSSTPVISIWGATHPYAGFYGWGQDPANAIQLDLPCRPCSIYGKTECMYGTYACLKGIKPKDVLKKIYESFE